MPPNYSSSCITVAIIISVSWLWAHTTSFSLVGWIVGTGTGCAGCKRVNTTVSCEETNITQALGPQQLQLQPVPPCLISPSTSKSGPAVSRYELRLPRYAFKYLCFGQSKSCAHIVVILSLLRRLVGPRFGRCRQPVRLRRRAVR